MKIQNNYIFNSLQNTEVNYSNFPERFIKNTKFLNKDSKKNFVSTFFFKPNLNIVFKQKQDLLKFNTFTKKSSPISLVLNEYESIEKLPMYNEGKWWVQDISSSIPIKLLGDVKEKEVLDLFSAPGGKAMQLIALGANVTCLDKSSIRIKILKENLDRMRMKSEIVKTDFYRFKTQKKFDLVVLDVPCSSTGTIRKNKEIQYLFPKKRLEQLKILLVKKDLRR